MQKLTVVVLAVAFAGTASAAGWRDLRVDGSSEEAFARSMTEFKDELSPRRAHVFGEALKDIWIQGATAAEAEQREYTADEYYKLLDGLRYEEVVNYTDPTGDTAEKRYRDARFMFKPRYASIERATTDPRYPVPWSYDGYARGSTDLKGAGQK